MNFNHDIALNGQLAKLNTARRQRKRAESDAVIYSVASNEAFDVASYNKARILRIHRKDIWFASNIALPKGQYAYIGFNMTEPDPELNPNQFHPVRIKGRTRSHDSSHRYRYRASYINAKGTLKKLAHKANFEKQAPKNINLQVDRDPRNIPRKSCYQAIFFYSENKKYQGTLTNLSRQGAYIQTNNNLFFRQNIEIEVPVNHSREGFRLLGKVIRVELNGVGLRLNRIIDTRRTGRNYRLSSARTRNDGYRTPHLITGMDRKKVPISVH